MSLSLANARRISLCGVFLLVPAGTVKPDDAQSTKPPQQPLYLPDPTPRPRDLHDEFGDNPSERARHEQAVALKKQQTRTQVLAAARDIVMLADQLREHMAHLDGSPPSPLDRMAAQKIEKLAKDVRAKMQMQQ